MKFLKIIVFIILFVCLFILAGATYMKFFLPDIDIKDLSVNISTQSVERGRYLANHVMLCIDCHSTRDWSKFTGPVIAGTEGMGGELFDQRMQGVAVVVGVAQE